MMSQDDGVEDDDDHDDEDGDDVGGNVLDCEHGDAP